MRISEIFYSIQGEGALCGMPSVFIRTSGCNLRCSWCDTKYSSWYPEGDAMSVERILEEIIPYPCHYAVLTGGEPMIDKDIHLLARGLKIAGKHVTIETAATVSPNGIVCDLASLSPKLSNSTPVYSGDLSKQHERRRMNVEAIREWANGYDYQVKFVISTELDLEEIDDLLCHVVVDASKVLLMPEGVDQPTIDARVPWIVKICKERGYRYCDRLHIRLFGNSRGT